MKSRKDGVYMVVGIDYYTRLITCAVINEKIGFKVTEIIVKWFKEGYISEEIITDNGREFISGEFKEMCTKYGINHTKVSVESHRSNVWVEWVISSIRESFRKDEGNTIEEKIAEIVEKYNAPYHASIKCSPNEDSLN